MRYNYVDDPWNVPVPVRSSTFTPLKKEHHLYNVEVDLSKIEPFSLIWKPYGRPLEPSAALYCDNQTNIDSNPSGRSGSGRSGLYRGKYLKGVGRTVLARNWNNAKDLDFNNGILRPSAAIREFLVSVYLKSQGLEHTLHGCEGLLFKSLPKKWIGYTDKVGEKEAHRIPPEIDRRFQAISVKPSGFSRLSNFTWMLTHIEEEDFFVGDLFFRFQKALDPTRFRTLKPERCEPKAVAEAFDRSVQRAFENFQSYFHAGVYWQAFQNNFTADGRFLDLEMPRILGSAFFGILDKRDLALIEYTGENRHFFGFELIEYVMQVRLFARFLIHRLEFLLKYALQGLPGSRAFIQGVYEEFKKRFKNDHLLFSNAKLYAWIEKMMREEFDMSRHQAALAGKMLRNRIAWHLEGKEAAKPIKLYNTRSFGFRFCMYGPKEAQFALKRADLAVFINEKLEYLYSLKTIDRLLLEIAKAEKEIMALSR